MKHRTASQIRLIFAAFGALLLLLGLLLWQGVRRGDAVRVGIPRSSAAYGAAMLLQTPSAQYTCVLGSTPKALQDALLAGDLDAALLPCDLALETPDCVLRAVLGYESLVVLSRGEPASTPAGLTDATVALQEELGGTGAEAMLRTLLKQEKIPCTLLYGIADTPADFYACDLDTAARLLAQDARLRLCFSCADAWRKQLSSLPPAGLCLAVRQEYLSRAGRDYTAFENALKNAMRYGDEKRKKTTAMAAAAGLAASQEEADLLYPYCDFLYLTGAEMNAALAARNGK